MDTVVKNLTRLHPESDSLDGCHIPRITIAAFCGTPAAAETISAAAADRRMARATVDVVIGSTKSAVEHYSQSPTPDLIVLERHASGAELVEELEALADICDAATKVLVIGASNDIALYRELLDRGISEYLVAPVHVTGFIAAVGRIYRDAGAKKLGKTYAFVGAKGGVGSSTVAHNVASTIARLLGSEVMLADMDLPFGTAGLDFNLETVQGVAEAIQDTGRVDELLLDRLLAKCDDRLSLLAAPTALDRAYDLDETAFDQMLEVAQVSTPNLVLDIPHVWTSWAKRLLVAADEVVITAAPDLANLRNAKNMVDVLKQARPNDAPPKIVLNQVGMPKRPEIKLADFADAVQIEPIAWIPFEPGLFGTAANKGQMVADVSPKSPVCGAFAELARALSGRRELKRRRGMFSARSLLNTLSMGTLRPKPAIGG